MAGAPAFTVTPLWNDGRMETAVLAERLLALDSDGGWGCEPGDLAELVAIVQRLNTAIAVATAGFDTTGALTADGYRSPAGFLTGEGGRLGRGTARRYLSCGRVLDQFPLLAAAAVAGEITFDHVATFARLLPASASEYRRVCLVRDEAELVAAAKVESVTDFSGRCVSWRHQVDPDDRLAERLGREEHGMTVEELDAGSSELRLRGPTGEIEQLRSAINRLADEGWRAQRSEAGETGRARTGVPDSAGGWHDEAGSACGEPDGSVSWNDDVLRTPVGDLTSGVDVVDEDEARARVARPVGGTSEPGLSRKRCQPLRGRLQSQAGAELAARALAGGGGRSGVAKPVVVVVMDWATFMTEAQRFSTGIAPTVDVFDPAYRCETLDGHPVPPEEAFWLAMRGEIQRCVIDADSLKVDLGRQQRLFNAAGRRAVQVRDRTCAHSACDLPAVWADIDHIIDWVLWGRTDTVNGQALCRFHHVQKHRTTAPPGGTTAAGDSERGEAA